MTNGWTDIRNADVVLAMGGNPAENHPVGFRFVMEARRNRNAKLVSVDPRFNRTAAVADRYVHIRAGTDIAFLGGLINYALTNKRYHDEYVRLFTNAPFLVSEQYAFDEKRGVFTGWDDEKKAYADKSSWNYELDGQGFAKVDPTLAHPRSVFQVMKRFYARYTPETVSNICGCNADDFVKAADLITSTHTPDRVGHELAAVGPGAGQGGEQEAGLDQARIRGQPADVEIAERRVAARKVVEGGVAGVAAVAMVAAPFASCLVIGGKARALLAGRTHVTPDDIRALAHPVLRHRILPNFRAEAEGITPEGIVDRLLKHVPLP